MTQGETQAALRRYADGEVGTRDTIEALGARDYGDLIVAMAQAGLAYPKPTAGAAHDARVAMASAILQPRLRLGA